MLEASTNGNDLIQGTPVDDLINNGQGDDIIIGGAGTNTFVYSRGDGHDTIKPVTDELYAPGIGHVVLHGIAAADVRVQRINGDLKLSFPESAPGLSDQGSILLQAALDGRKINVGSITFDDGTVWTLRQAVDIGLAQQATAGNDIIYGSEWDDVLFGGAGNDHFVASGGTDTYVYHRGDGNDTIQSIDGYVSNGPNILVLHGIMPNELKMFTNTRDLRIVVPETSPGSGNGGSVQILTNPKNNDDTSVRFIRFDNGTEWTIAQAIAFALAQNNESQTTDGDDTIFGTSGNDYLRGGKGDDHLGGGLGNDTYAYTLGDGHDTISNATGWVWQGVSTLLLHNLNPSDLVLTAMDNNLTITIPAGTNGEASDGSIQIQGSGDNFGSVIISNIVFDDGTTWTYSQALQLAVTAQATAGNDTIIGSRYSDIIDGGLGNDTLIGKEGDNTYVYSLGDGHDVITNETGPIGQGNNKLVLHGVSPSDLVLTTSDNNLTIGIPAGTNGNASAGSIQIAGSNDYWASPAVRTIVFDDGTVWTYQQALQVALNALTTTGSDVIVGTRYDDVISGGLGNDTLSGGPGSDTYVYTHGDGHDVITNETGSIGQGQSKLVLHGLTPADLMVATSNNNLTISVPAGINGVASTGSIQISGSNDLWGSPAVRTIVFDDGTIWTYEQALQIAVSAQATAGNDTVIGTRYNDVLTGGLGNDILKGGAGTDTYVYTRGDGHDTISNQTEWTGQGENVLRIHGVAMDDLRFTSTGENITLSILASSATAGDAGTIQIMGAGDNWGNPVVRQIILDDGTVLTYLQALQMATTAKGTAGNDTIVGTRYAETIIGAGGDDILKGGLGNDTYVYRRGDGNDVIQNNTEWSAHGNNTVLFDDIASTQVRFSNTATGLRVVVPETTTGAGDGGSIAMDAVGDYFGNREIRTFTFADGVSLTYEQAQALANTATDGDDLIIGTTGSDTLSGGLGNDRLQGGGGSDTYVYSRGDGHDTIADGTIYEHNHLVLHDIDPASVRYQFVGYGLRVVIDESVPGANDGGSILVEADAQFRDIGLDTITFDNGVVHDRSAAFAKVTEIFGDAGNDTLVGNAVINYLEGGLGNDRMEGGLGADTYVFNRGDGHDRIVDYGHDGSLDVLKLHGYTASEVQVTSTWGPGEIVLSMGPSNSITMENEGTPPFDSGVDHVVLDDGTIWTRDDLRFKAYVDTNPAHDVKIDTGIYVNQNAFIGGNGDTFYIVDAGLPAITIKDLGGDDTLTLRNVSQTQAGFEIDTQTQDLIISLHDIPGRANSTVTIANGLGLSGIETFTFNDGTMTAADIQNWITNHQDAA